MGHKLVAWHKRHCQDESQLQQHKPDLSGDRQIEWSYTAAWIGYYANQEAYVLDFGCGLGALSFVAASLGATVLAIDLMPQGFETTYPNIEFRQTSVMLLDESYDKFDLVINCSTIEHVGLSERYNSTEAPDGDFDAMRKLLRLLKPGGIMLLTLPIGQDAVFRPLHRIYGPERLPRLLEGYQIVESQFLRKDSRNIWMLCEQEEAMSEIGNDHYYALGCMVLRKN